MKQVKLEVEGEICVWEISLTQIHNYCGTKQSYWIMKDQDLTCAWECALCDIVSIIYSWVIYLFIYKTII